MTQDMERAEIFFGQSLPSFTASGRPKVARQAASETFTAIVDLNLSLLAMVAVGDLVIFRHFDALTAASAEAASPRARANVSRRAPAYPCRSRRYSSLR